IPAGGGGFGGPPAGGSTPAGGPGGAGFNPTDRIIEQLGLDKTDPAVKTALDACASILTNAFQPAGSTASTTTTTP
ncbi:MAG: acyl-CoA dehydrogenase family protein, partial [Ilumatobacteraceae bacterium]